MELYEVIKKRRSIREYQAREVENEKLQKVLDAAHLAPSAKKKVLINKRDLEQSHRRKAWFWE